MNATRMNARMNAGMPVRGAARAAVVAGLLLAIAGCGPAPIDPKRQIGADPYLPPIHQYLLPPMHVAKVVGWNGATPNAAPGLKVQLFASGLANPRSLYVLPNGDVWGRPVGVTVAADGSLFVSDDGSKSIWHVSYTGK